MATQALQQGATMEEMNTTKIDQLVEAIDFDNDEWVNEFVSALAEMDLTERDYNHVSRKVWACATTHGYKTELGLCVDLYQKSIYGESCVYHFSNTKNKA